MYFFSKLAQRHSGQINLQSLLISAAVSGVVLYGLYSYTHEQNIVDGLKATAMELANESSVRSQMEQYLAAERMRLDQAHEKNQSLLDQIKNKSVWLSALSGSLSYEGLTQEEYEKYVNALRLLSQQKVAVNEVGEALVQPEMIKSLTGSQIETMRHNLTKENLATYASIRHCAVNGSGEGAYCGAAAALGARLASVLKDVDVLEHESEAYSREALGRGWDDWDEAEQHLMSAAFMELARSKEQVKEAFDRGDLSQEDWDSMGEGFNAAQNQVLDQISQDRRDLEHEVQNGSVSGHHWYLLSHWAHAAPIKKIESQLVSHQYVAGGRFFQEPQRREPSASAAAVSAHSNSGSTHAFLSVPRGTPPYSIASGDSHLGRKVDLSFNRAIGSKMSSEMKNSGIRGGLASKVSAYSTSKASAHAESVSVAHAGVGHSSAHSAGG